MPSLDPSSHTLTQTNKQPSEEMNRLSVIPLGKEAILKAPDEVTPGTPQPYHVTVKASCANEREIAVSFSDGTIHHMKTNRELYKKHDPFLEKGGTLGYDFASALAFIPNTLLFGSNNQVFGCRSPLIDTIGQMEDAYTVFPFGPFNAIKPRITHIVVVSDRYLLAGLPLRMLKITIFSNGYAYLDYCPGRPAKTVFLGHSTPQICVHVVGHLLITAGADGTTCAWDWKKGVRLWRSNQDFSIEMGQFANEERDEAAKKSCAQRADEEVSLAGGKPFCVHRAGKMVIGYQDGGIRVIKTLYGSKVAEMTTTNDAIVGLFYLDNHYISCSQDGAVRIWSSKTYELVRTMQLFTASMTMCGLLRDSIVGIGQSRDLWGDIIPGEEMKAWKVASTPGNDSFYYASGWDVYFGSLDILRHGLFVSAVRKGDWFLEVWDVKISASD